MKSPALDLTKQNQLSFESLDVTLDQVSLGHENIAWNIASIIEAQSTVKGQAIALSSETYTPTVPTQIQIGALEENRVFDPKGKEHVEWNIASIKVMQQAIVNDAADLVSKSIARPDNLEDIFAWVFDTDNDDAFGITECASSFKQTVYELQARFYRRLKRTMNSLPKSCKQPKRDFYVKLARKARIELAKNAASIQCTEVEAKVAEMEDVYRPH